MADLMRISGKSVTARTSMTPHAWLAESPCNGSPRARRTALCAPSQPTTKTGIDRFHLALMPGIEALEMDRDRCVRSIRRDYEVKQAAGVIGFEAGRGVAHDIEVEV